MVTPKIDLIEADLHTPLFLDKKNWGTKLNVKDTRKGKIIMAYDRENMELLVKHGDAIAIIPVSNVVSMVPAPSIASGIQEAAAETGIIAQAQKAKRERASAQVSTPVSHVAAGLGAGRTND